MTKKEQYIALRNAGTSREEAQEEMGMSANLEQKYNSLYYRDVERDNRKDVESLPGGMRIDGTPKPKTAAEAEREIVEALGLIERKTEPVTEAPAQDAEPAEIMPPTPQVSPEIGALVIRGEYADYRVSLDVTVKPITVSPSSLKELGQKLAAEMARVERMLAGALS